MYPFMRGKIGFTQTSIQSGLNTNRRVHRSTAAMPAIVAQHTQCRRIEKKMASIGYRKSEPSRGERSKKMTMSEYGDVVSCATNPGNNAFEAGSNLRRTFAAWTAVIEDEPPGIPGENLLWRQPFIVTVIPFEKIRIDFGIIAEPASSEVSRARPSGLVNTRSKFVIARSDFKRFATLRPFSVRGMSVSPVWRPA